MAKLPLGLARKLRDDVKAMTRGVPMRWVSVCGLALRHTSVSNTTVEAAIALAIDKGWMLGEGSPPHSVCLTDAGRRG